MTRLPHPQFCYPVSEGTHKGSPYGAAIGAGHSIVKTTNSISSVVPLVGTLF